jgi:hypothetical protein
MLPCGESNGVPNLMKVCGFSIAYHALRFGYPIEASLRSMLPLADELILNIGEGDDDTWNLVQWRAEDQAVSFVVKSEPAGRWAVTGSTNQSGARTLRRRLGDSPSGR